jgi:hypothetical protein
LSPRAFIDRAMTTIAARKAFSFLAIAPAPDSVP